MLAELDNLADQQLKLNKAIVDEYTHQFAAQYKSYKIGFFVFQGIITLVFGLIIVGLHRQVLQALKCVVETSEALANGALNKKMEVNGRPEVKRVANAFNKVIQRSFAATDFAVAIGKADFTAHLETDGSDRLSEALLGMRDKLKEATDNTQQQHWAVEGLGKFEVLMRQQYASVEQMGDKLLSELVRYIGANQAALFVLKNGESAENRYLEMTSCYALDRKKHLHKQVKSGEGLVGQCLQEQETFYFNDIPESYVQIKSGLGGAQPRTLLVTPLIYNEEVHGVLEIAGFNEIPEHVREFISKLTENIAATLGRQLYATKIEELLSQAKMNTEQMQSQEEEMRQHMEEMMATQEEMERKEREYQEMIKALEAEMLKHNISSPMPEMMNN